MTLPATFYLVDVNLLSIELSDIKVEEAFFNSNPDKGSFLHWPIIGNILKGTKNDLIGSLLDPNKEGESLRKEYAKHLDSLTHDQLPSKMTTLRKDLFTPRQNISVVYYIHCEAGEDRTGWLFCLRTSVLTIPRWFSGEVSGAYYIRYLNMTFQKAMDIDDTNENRNIEYEATSQISLTHSLRQMR